MIEASQLKNGTAFVYQGQPYQVLKFTLTKLGRGGATVRVNARNLVSNAVKNLTFNSGKRVEDVDLQKVKLQFLYSDGGNAVFIDPNTFEQVEVPLTVLGGEANFLKEGETAQVLFWEGKAISIELPPKVILKVVETTPGVKGDTASNAYKDAVLENKLSVKVPLFIKAGDLVKVDTRDGSYVERAKEVR